MVSLVPPLPEPRSGGSGGWGVQTGAFKQRGGAEQQVAKLAGKGFSAVVLDAAGFSKGLFRVRVVAVDKAAAQTLKVRLARAGFAGSLVEQ